MNNASNLQVVASDEPKPLPQYQRQRVSTRALFERITDGRPLYREQDGSTPIYNPERGVYDRDAEQVITRAYAAERGDDFARSELADVLAYSRASAHDKREPAMQAVNVRNGILDPQTRKLYAHTPGLHSTIQIGASFDPRATAPITGKFLESVLAPDVHARILEHVGNTIAPTENMQRAVIMHGSGSNGKSVFQGQLLTLVGWLNASFATAHQIAEDPFAASLMELKLVNLAADLEAHELRRGTGVLKAIISGDPIVIQRKYEQPREVRISARLWFSTNTLPPTADITPGFFRRWDIVPFTRTFSHAEADPNLALKLNTWAELNGLLNLALDGLDRLRSNGTFSPSSTIDAANARYRVDADSVAAFVEDAIAIGADYSIKGTALFSAFEQFCDNTGRRPCGVKLFYERLANVPALHGRFEKTTQQRAVLLRGLGLR